MRTIRKYSKLNTFCLLSNLTSDCKHDWEEFLWNFSIEQGADLLSLFNFHLYGGPNNSYLICQQLFRDGMWGNEDKTILLRWY